MCKAIIFPDVQTGFQLSFINREGRPVQPKVLAAMLSNLLYERRFGPYFVSPLIAGLDDDNNPFVSSFDLIGCGTQPVDFVVGGTCEESLYGKLLKFLGNQLRTPRLGWAMRFAILRCIIF